MRSFLLVLLLLLTPALYLYSAENPPSPQRQTNLPANQSLGDDPPVTWYLKAAEQGHASAQFNLAFLYSKGYGVPQDYFEARKWLLRAADQGHAPAQHNLGFVYSKGYGVAQDYVEARKWYLKAAEQGDASSQHNLGFLYSNGQGVPQQFMGQQSTDTEL